MINLRYSVVTGGIEMIAQAQELNKKPHIVVATPGRFVSVNHSPHSTQFHTVIIPYFVLMLSHRLADHLRSCDTFSLKLIKFLVIDEADRLLGGRFNDQLKTIFDTLPKKKQILMFSATLTDSIEQVKLITSKQVLLNFL